MLLHKERKKRLFNRAHLHTAIRPLNGPTWLGTVSITPIALSLTYRYASVSILIYNDAIPIYLNFDLISAMDRLGT